MRRKVTLGSNCRLRLANLGLDRNELGAFLVQAGLGSARDHPLASLLALNGLRISDALDADIDTWSTSWATGRSRSSERVASTQ